MQAVHITRFGGPEVLDIVDLPRPVPGSGQVGIAVHAAEVLFLDTMLRAGRAVEHFDIRPPFVPGNGVVGVVTELGPDVEGPAVGTRVAASLSTIGHYAGGGYAAQAVADVADVHVVPDGVDLHAATAALSDAVMGISRIERAEVGPDDVVLVLAAAGGIASWAIPEARRRGATVVGAARGDHKLAAARALGAHHVVDYSEGTWPDRVRAVLDRAVSVVFDGTGGSVAVAATELVRPGGRFDTYGTATDEGAELATAAAARELVFIGFEDEEIDDHDRRRWTRDGLRLLAEGRVRPTLGQVRPLRDAAAVHAAIEARAVAGKSLLVPDPTEEDR